MAKFITTIQNKYLNNKITKHINKTTNILGVYGGIGGSMIHSLIEKETNYKKIFDENNIHKDLMIRSYKVFEAGIYGGVVWSIIGKTFPVFIPCYSIYKGFETNFNGKNIFSEFID
jgi:hypothetical protein